MKTKQPVRQAATYTRGPNRASRFEQELAARGYSRQPGKQNRWTGIVDVYDAESGKMSIRLESLYRCNDA